MTENMQEIQALTQKRNRKQMLRIFFGRGILVKACTVFLVTAIFSSKSSLEASIITEE